ncbi:MAG: FecR family protein [Muribaculaceae bacterium]
MDILEKKYKTGEITPEELVELRKRVMSMDDSSLEDRLLDDWQNGDPVEDAKADERIKAIKQQLDKQLFGDSDIETGDESADDEQPSKRWNISWGWIAAAVLVPFFMLTTFYFYREASSMENDKVLFATAEGQHAAVTLPDGTEITLNASSNLAYSPADFNSRSRHIDFNGEAYFDVSKNKDVPFVIHSHEITVKVLGTKFNFEAYPDHDSGKLALDEGKVEISLGEATRTLVAGQIAMLDYHSKSITVTDSKTTADASAWKNFELVFRSTPVIDVVKKIELAYGVKIHFNDAELADDKFSGSLPTNDLVNALEIIGISCGLDYRIEGKEIHFAKH